MVLMSQLFLLFSLGRGLVALEKAENREPAVPHGDQACSLTPPVTVPVLPVYVIQPPYLHSFTGVPTAGSKQSHYYLASALCLQH